jgi:hypothetical protein
MLCRVSETGQSEQTRQRGSENDRLAYLVIAITIAVVLVTARLLSPAPSGIGTHEQLGLPPCIFHILTGHGCPGCGLTTAFAYMAQGDVSSALQANPTGVVLFAFALLGGAASVYLIYRPRPANDLFQTWIVQGLALGILLGSILIWIVRLAMGEI